VLLSLGFSFEFKRYLKGFLLLAIATTVFSLVNIAISTIPDTVTIGGGDIRQLCGNITTVTVTLTPTPTPSNIININFYDPFNTLNTTYWVKLTQPWTVDNGYVRTTVTDTSYNNAIYYIVDFIEPEHDTVQLNTRVKISSSPNYNELRYYCVFLTTTDLKVRILGCIETYNYANSYYYVYARIHYYQSGSDSVLASTTIVGSSYSSVIPGTRDLSLSIAKINDTYSTVTLTGLSPVTVQISWNNLGYFGFFMSHTYSGEGFDFIDAWITSQYATDTVYYNISFPPPLPVITTTDIVTETKIIDLSKDIIVLPLGSFIRVLSFGIYVVYIVRTIKHFTPEF
jgi:hypothetical protein